MSESKPIDWRTEIRTAYIPDVDHCIWLCEGTEVRYLTREYADTLVLKLREALAKAHLSKNEMGESAKGTK